MSLVIHNSVQSGLLTASQADILGYAIAVYVSTLFSPYYPEAGRKGMLQMIWDIL